ncbi:HAD family hydrolase [Kitasatospora griseola]|uniref:hypothetical protein n=1 Tax=Kitasatospora griseola TaxID=2064 RepID=UPI0038242B6F
MSVRPHPGGSHFLAPPGPPRPERAAVPVSRRPWRFLRNRRPRPDAVLFDLGVLTRPGGADPAAGDRAADLPPGTVARYAREHPSYEAALLGLTTEQRWLDGVRRRLAEEVGAVPARVAVRAWRADPWHRREAMVAVLRRVHESGVRCALVANTTGSLNGDVGDRLTVEAYSSAELGVTTPSPLAFSAVADRMGLHPDQVLFAASTPTAAAGARAAGMEAGSATTPPQLRALLAALGIQVQALAAA